jgi:hypothetical protein
MTDTLQSGAESAVDLDKLEALARAATPGPWDWGGTECASQEQALAICKENLDATVKPGTHFCEVFLADGRRTALVGNGPTGIENAEFIAAANPAVVLDLIALARRATAPHAAIEQADLRATFEQTEAGQNLSRAWGFGLDSNEYANPYVQHRWVGFQRGAATNLAGPAVGGGYMGTDPYKRLFDISAERAPTCPSCGGNDREAPCAYPSEGKPGCLRDVRLAERACPNCEGSGRISPVELCSRCNQSGVLPGMAERAPSGDTDEDAGACAEESIDTHDFYEMICSFKRGGDGSTLWSDIIDHINSYVQRELALARRATAGTTAAPIVSPGQIPNGIYYSVEHDNFYSVDNKGMGQGFYDLWAARKGQFPVAPFERATAGNTATAAPGDLTDKDIGRFYLAVSHIGHATNRELAFARAIESEVRARCIASNAGAAPAIPEGFALVPRTMTIEMHVAFAEVWFSKVRPIDDHDMQDAYAAMLDAAPSNNPPVGAAQEKEL